jgi:hypothetical protein
MKSKNRANLESANRNYHKRFLDYEKANGELRASIDTLRQTIAGNDSRFASLKQTSDANCQKVIDLDALLYDANQQLQQQIALTNARTEEVDAVRRELQRSVSKFDVYHHSLKRLVEAQNA